MADTSVTFRLLADQTRRRLLIQLFEEESVDVSEGVLLRSGVGTASSNPAQPKLVRSERSRTRTAALHHNHLPRLQSHGIIEWDQETQTVSQGEAFEEVEPLLRLLCANTHVLPNGFL